MQTLLVLIGSVLLLVVVACVGPSETTPVRTTPTPDPRVFQAYIDAIAKCALAPDYAQALRCRRDVGSVYQQYLGVPTATPTPIPQLRCPVGQKPVEILSLSIKGREVVIQARNNCYEKLEGEMRLYTAQGVEIDSALSFSLSFSPIPPLSTKELTFKSDVDPTGLRAKFSWCRSIFLGPCWSGP